MLLSSVLGSIIVSRRDFFFNLSSDNFIIPHGKYSNLLLMWLKSDKINDTKYDSQEDGDISNILCLIGICFTTEL